MRWVLYAIIGKKKNKTYLCSIFFSLLLSNLAGPNHHSPSKNTVMHSMEICLTWRNTGLSVYPMITILFTKVFRVMVSRFLAETRLDFVLKNSFEFGNE